MRGRAHGVLAACLCSYCTDNPGLRFSLTFFSRGLKDLESHWRPYCGIPLPRNVTVEFFFFPVKQDFSGIKNTSMNFFKLDQARIFSSGNSFPPPSQTGLFFLFKTS